MNKKIQELLKKGKRRRSLGGHQFKAKERKEICNLIGVDWSKLNQFQRSKFKKDMLSQYNNNTNIMDKSFYAQVKPSPGTNVMTRDQWDQSSIGKEVKRLFS